MKLSVLFFGSPLEVVPVLEAMTKDEDIKITAVVTQPDRPAGRKKLTTRTAVKAWAEEHGLNVLTPKEFNEGFYWEITSPHSNVRPDIAVLAAYGAILPYRLLTLPKYGFLNLHPSLLPAYRGASPCTPPILKGDRLTGLTIIQMDEAMDHGPIVAQLEARVLPDDNHRSLEMRLFKLGAEVLPEVMKAYVSSLSGAERSRSGLMTSGFDRFSASTMLSQKTTLLLPPKEQNHQQASFTKLLQKEDGFVPWDVVEMAMNQNTEYRSQKSEVIKLFSEKLRPWLEDDDFPEELPVAVERFIRALSPWPGAWTTIAIKDQKINSKNTHQRLKILSAHVKSSSKFKQNSILILDTVRLEGRKTMSWAEFKKLNLAR
jgi:methionyl-tRNA formyltransferase